MENEGIQDFSKPIHQATAGAITGIVECSIMYPVDLLKTRMQILRPYSKANYRSVFSGLRKITLDEGISRLFRGMPLPLMASIPAHAAQYSTYEFAKRAISGTEFGTQNYYAHFLAGTFAVIAHDFFMNPADVIKQRMQVYGSSYQSSLHCLRSIVRSEGTMLKVLKVLYRSYPTQAAIDVPGFALQFVVYEACQNFLNPSRGFDAKSHILSGAIGGSFAAAVTTPLDVCRTLINTQERAALGEIHRAKIRGLVQAVITVNQLHGLGGFTRGLTARVMYTVPSTAICWCTYEFFKHYLSEKCD